MASVRNWSLLTGLVVVVILVAGWFGLVSPVRAQTADFQAQTVAQESDNETLRTRIAQLKVEALELEQQQKRINKLEKRIPKAVELPELTDALAKAGATAKLVVVEIAPSPPMPMTPPQAAAPAPAATPAPGSDPAAAPAAPVAAEPAQPDLYMVPLTLKLEGGYENIHQFLAKLETMRRVFLVTGVSIRVGTAETPDVVPGLEATILGRAFTRSPNSVVVGNEVTRNAGAAGGNANKVDPNAPGGLG